MFVYSSCFSQKAGRLLLIYYNEISQILSIGTNRKLINMRGWDYATHILTFWKNFKSLLTNSYTIKEKDHPKFILQTINLKKLWTTNSEPRWANGAAPLYSQLWNQQILVSTNRINLDNKILQYWQILFQFLNILRHLKKNVFLRDN